MRLSTATRIACAAGALALPSISSAQGICDEGCTPGYWKTHTERWDGAGGDDFTQTVTWDMSFNAVFGVTEAQSGLPDSATLLDALKEGGGSLTALNRHASAALASADAVCYPLTVGQVIDLYRDAVDADPGPATIDSAHADLEDYNESNCPLSNSTPPPPPRYFCVADEGDCPCGVDGLLAGCPNSSGLGARIDASGSSSVASDDLLLVATQLPANTMVLFLMADALQRMQFFDGLLCIGGPTSKIYRLPPVLPSGSEGTATYGPGLVAASQTPFVPVPGGIQPGETWYFQTYFRDMSGCSGIANTSNVVAVTFTP